MKVCVSNLFWPAFLLPRATDPQVGEFPNRLNLQIAGRGPSGRGVCSPLLADRRGNLKL